MRLFAFFFLIIVSAHAQLPITEQAFFARLTTGNTLPETLLNKKTVVFYSFTFTEKELETIHGYLQRSGIDAVAYYEDDYLIGGRDLSMETAQRLISREIANLVLVKKDPSKFQLYIASYNGKANFIDSENPVWFDEDPRLDELMKRTYRTVAGSGLKKENYLINDFPETGFTLNPINGNRNEFYAIDLKVDMLAVPRFGDEEMDRQLEDIFKSYPLKFNFTDPNTSETELRSKGNLFVLRFVKARAKVAKSVLGYDMTKSESAITSIMQSGGQPQLKTIPANDVVYKFYFKHIESGNVYLGTKWDADQSWQQALINQIQGFKTEFKIN